jgi:hypothetical protein
MDTGQAIEQLARAEARRTRPITDPEELDELDARVGRTVPAFRIVRAPTGAGAGALRAEPAPGREGRGHDNAERLPFVCDFLNRRVLPLLSAYGDDGGDLFPSGAFGGRSGGSLEGTYRVELHDSYTYLPGRAGYAEVLSFGRATDAEERRVALAPDPYHMGGFGGALGVAASDGVPWASKEPVLFFAGTTTGDRDPARNARLRACVWSLSRPDVSRMLITNIAQMSPDAILAAHPAIGGAFHAPVPLEDHFRYRYQANIVGNTACWSRLPMILSGRSLAVHVRHSDSMWYYPLLREGRHYVGAESVEGEDLLRALAFCRSYDRQCRAMVDEANALARDLFHPGAAATYLAALLDEAAHLGRA